jgi:isocitrate dehydrogenase
MSFSNEPMAHTTCAPPKGGKISIAKGNLQVPPNPVIPFIRGDGTGPDIWASSVRVFDAAVEKADGEARKISWFEVFAGETAKNKFDKLLPHNTVDAYEEYPVGIKGLNGAIGCKRVTYDFARQMEGATEIKCSEFGDNIISHM